MFLDPWTMDAMVLAWLALSWLGYPRLVALIGRRRPSIDSSMLAVRKSGCTTCWSAISACRIPC